jgi:uncharacterized protein with ATP-grasp and redox domains
MIRTYVYNSGEQCMRETISFYWPKIISSGSSAPGTILHLCNDEFISQFKNADMVISKGQGNY